MHAPDDPAWSAPVVSPEPGRTTICLGYGALLSVEERAQDVVDAMLNARNDGVVWVTESGERVAMQVSAIRYVRERNLSSRERRIGL
jgi:hypothetical protein